MSTTNTNSLHKIMTLIDNHSEEIPEGDYLDMCNTLRDIFRNGETQTRRTRTLPSSLRINPMDVIFERCMVLVRKRKEYKKLINLTKPRIRITNIFKREAIHAYCGALELPLCNTIEDLNIYRRNDSNVWHCSCFRRNFMKFPQLPDLLKISYL